MLPKAQAATWAAPVTTLAQQQQLHHHHSPFHFQHRGIVTVFAPSQDVAKSASIPEVAPEHRQTVERINKMLRSRARFRLKMEWIWRREVGRGGTLTFEDLPDFLAHVAEKLDLPTEAFDNNEFVFMYDFTGDGALQFKEAYTLIKDKIANYRKSLGGHPIIDVPRKTPAEAGYKIVKLLAAGGQGSANLASDQRNQPKVLKVYLKGQANAVSLDDLREEMENMKKAQHPHIAVCHEIFQDASNLYMVSDPYMGGDLETLQKRALAQKVELTEDWYRWIFTQAFTGLDYLHRSCVVHCDIKEPNLMVKAPNYECPEIVIIDLGLASTLKPNRGACGTPGYMPPETWEFGAWFPRGDVFSMGVVCIQMLSNNIPVPSTGKPGIFQRARSVQEVARLTKTVEPPYDDMDPSSGELLEWLVPCLSKDYQQRPKPAEVLEYPWFDDGSTPGLCGRKSKSACCL
uniref:Protein kinase domain-containing protein n=1 Tax=Alexandrium andersonii TaxID=327968 RepID=A0A7S2EZE2_9DINO|mmetsp:Transcript_104671/g.235023  ORF Transcript_104671/g.235023 Transcript_104671/m.235023 type:complete len:459 (+) Transcript_104671:80-1456(+)